MLPHITTKSLKSAQLLLSVDKGREIKKMISIGDPAERMPGGSSKVQDVLRLEFRDDDRKNLSEAGPSKAVVLEIINFAQKAKEEAYGGIWLIHCHAGKSRSTATAFICYSVLLGDGKEEKALDLVYHDNEEAFPNDLLVEYADDLLGRKGKMNAALKEKPYGPNFMYPCLVMRARERES